MMLPTALAPFQFSLALGGELGGGYDSTAINPRTGYYENAPLLYGALEGQATHETDRIRQLLYDRFEAQYSPLGGRDPLDSDIFNVTRYALVFDVNEDVALHTDASYAIGAPTLFYSRAGRPDVSFARRGIAFPHQMVADWAVRQDAVYRFLEDDALMVEGAVAGRYPVNRQPAGQYLFTPYAGARWAHAFDELNFGQLIARAEYYGIELFKPSWVFHLSAGWGHRFTEEFSAYAEAGALMAQSDVNSRDWDPQPFGRVTLQYLIPRYHLAVGATYARTFGVVSSTLGTGPLDVASLAAIFRPGSGKVSVWGDASFQHGVGSEPGTQANVTSSFFTATAGVRYRFTPAWAVFARYDFQWEISDDAVAAGLPDFVRHVVYVGASVAWGTDEEALGRLVPLDELQTMLHAEGVGTDPGATPARELQYLHDDADGRPRRTRLPGDPPDDEVEREERERQRSNGGGNAAPGDDAPLPGDGEPADPGDPLQDRDREGDR